MTWRDELLKPDWTPIGERGLEYRYVWMTGAWYGYIKAYSPRQGQVVVHNYLCPVWTFTPEKETRLDLFRSVYMWEKAHCL